MTSLSLEAWMKRVMGVWAKGWRIGTSEAFQGRQASLQAVAWNRRPRAPRIFRTVASSGLPSGERAL